MYLEFISSGSNQWLIEQNTFYINLLILSAVIYNLKADRYDNTLHINKILSKITY